MACFGLYYHIVNVVEDGVECTDCKLNVCIAMYYCCDVHGPDNNLSSLLLISYRD